MDRMLNQRWVSLEQETEWKHVESLEVHYTDFLAKTDAALERYKQGRRPSSARYATWRRI
jgi:hypothetical protein